MREQRNGMPDLIASGTETSHRWRRTLEDGHCYVVGRASGTWSTPWDQHISRRHAEVCWKDDQLHVKLLPEARNPIFVRGKQKDQFALRPGEHFVIGGTTFTLSEARAQVTGELPMPVTEHTYSPVFLQRTRFRYADQRIDVLSRLPEIIAGSASDMELFVRLVNVLLAGIPGASAVALIAVDPASPTSPIQVLHW